MPKWRRPATAEARLVLQFMQPSGQSGAVHLDDVTFGVVALGDFNGDGAVDAADFDLWRADFGSRRRRRAPTAIGTETSTGLIFSFGSAIWAAPRP